MSDDAFKGFRITSDPDVTSIEQPGKDPARETSKLPLRLLLVSNLAPQSGAVNWAEAPSQVHRVDKHSFGALMQRMAPRLRIDVANTISEAPKLLEVDLSFSSLDAFHPAHVATQVPALKQLLAIRTLVSQVNGGKITLDTFREQLAETGVDEDWAEQLYQALAAPADAPRPAAPPSASSSGGDAALDRILGLVGFEGDEAAAPPAASGSSDAGGFLGALLGAVSDAEESAPKVEKSAAALLLGDLDGLLDGQLNAIVGHAAFRELEAGWRGLKFMVDRIDFRQGVSLEVLAASKDDLSAALYYQILMPEHHAGDDADHVPLSAVLLDFDYGNGKADVEALEDLAETGASLQAPVIVAASAAFFGVEAEPGLAALPPLWQHVERPEYIAWNKLREKKETTFLAMALPSFLLRPSYGPDAPVKVFSFTEKGQLWGRAPFVVGVRIAGSFTQTGWPTHLTGTTGGRRIENLPLWKSRQGHIPLSVLIPDSKLSEYAKGGFVVLGGEPNKDGLYVARAQTVCQPEAYEDLMAATEARIHVTLACQLFVARAAHQMLVIQQALTPGTPLDQVQQEVEARLRAFFHTPGQTVPPDAVEVTPVDNSGVPNQDLLAVRLVTPQYVMDRPVSLVMGLPVSRTADA